MKFCIVLAPPRPLHCMFACSDHPAAPTAAPCRYPDVIESCPPPGSGQKHSHTIKSHHNVGGLPKDLQFTLIEPFRELFKDEVRLFWGGGSCRSQEGGTWIRVEHFLDKPSSLPTCLHTKLHELR